MDFKDERIISCRRAVVPASATRDSLRRGVYAASHHIRDVGWRSAGASIVIVIVVELVEDIARSIIGSFVARRIVDHLHLCEHGAAGLCAITCP